MNYSLPVRKLLTGAAVALCGGTLYGQNLSISQTQEFSGIPNYSEDLIFNLYNGSLESLESVEILYSLTVWGGEFNFDNDANTPATITVTFGASLSATSSGPALLNSSFSPIISTSSTTSGTFALEADNGDGALYDFTAPDGGTLLGELTTTSGSGTVADLLKGGYVGDGTFSISALASQVGYLDYSSGVQTATTPVNSSGYVTVIYHTTLPIPEPSSFLMLGLAGVVCFTKRRR